MAQQKWQTQFIFAAFAYLMISAFFLPCVATAAETATPLTTGITVQDDDTQSNAEVIKKTMKLAPGTEDALPWYNATVLSCDELLNVDAYGQVSLSNKASVGNKYKAVFISTSTEYEPANGDNPTARQSRIELTVTAIPPTVEIDSLCEGAGELAVFWKKLPARMRSGYQIQVSTSKSFKSRKTVKAKTKSYYKRVKALKGGKQYYVRIRAFKVSGNKTVYGTWSSPAHSNKLDKRTSTALADQKFGWTSYKKIKKTGTRYGWKVSSMSRSTGTIGGAGGSSEVRLWYVGCTNAKYHYSINLSGLFNEVFWADLYDETGNIVKEIHTHMAPSSYESAMINNLKKGILADLKKFSSTHKKPHLSVETLRVAGGDKAVITMLNTKKKVKWDFVVGDTLKKETRSEEIRIIESSMKLKKLSNNSVRLTIVKSALPYDSFPSSYYLRATVDGKKYYVMLKWRTTS